MPEIARPSTFTGDRARDRLLDAYDRVAASRWPVPVVALDVPTSWGTVRVLRAGPTDGEPVVLLAGAGGNALSWSAHVGLLARHRAVYALDPLGEPGHSVADRPITRGEDVAAWIGETLAALGVRGAHLVGSSFGGWSALVAERADAEGRIGALTLVDPAGFAPVGAPFYRWVVLGGLAALLPRRLRHGAAGRLVNGTLRDDDLMRLALAGRGFRRRLPAPPVLTDAELAAVDVPVSLLLGEHSALHDAGAVAGRVHTVAPHWQVEVVAGTGHALPVEAPQLVVDRVLHPSATGGD